MINLIKRAVLAGIQAVYLSVVSASVLALILELSFLGLMPFLIGCPSGVIIGFFACEAIEIN